MLLLNHRKAIIQIELKEAKELESALWRLLRSTTVIEEESERPSTMESSKTRVGKSRKLEGKNRDSKTKTGKKGKSKFFEYLEMEMGGGGGLLPKEDDLRLERKLAKKLKVKNGKLGGIDELAMLLEGVPSALDTDDGEDALPQSLQGCPSRKKQKKQRKLASEKIESQKNMDGLSNSVDAGSDEHDNVEEPSDSKDTKKKKRKANSLEYLEMREVGEGAPSATEAFSSEKKLKKRLKKKEGSLHRDDDDINKVSEGIPSVVESLDIVESRKIESAEQEQTTQTTIAISSRVDEPMKIDHGTDVALQKVAARVSGLGRKTKYVAPHLRSRVQGESEETAQIRKRVRGLLNRLSESNVESITGQISTIFQSLGRSVGSQIICDEILASCSGGPRGNEQYAATFTAFVAGMACSVGIDFGAKLLALLAKCFEMEYLEEDNLSLRNLTLLLSFLYTFGVCTSGLIYDFLIMLSKRLTEVDVSTILTILQSCGMKLSEDPIGMKDFIHTVQQRVQELKASSGDEKSIMSGRRMEFMLDTICEIKNKKKRPKEETLQHTRIKKLLQKLRVEDILIRGMKWSKLLDPEKKGQWWLSGDVASTADNIEEVAIRIDRGVSEVQKMLQLAAAQRMNTDARRAIFCIIMTADDYKDAFAKLLSVDLPGKQDREIMRVLVECCLQEKVFNKYYCILAHKLCTHDKNHKFTLQYCIWDQFKELESTPLMRSMHLSKFVASMIACFSLSLAVLKVVDFIDPTQLTPKRIMHFKMLFEAIFEFSDKLIWNVFTRIALTPEYESLRVGIKFFVTEYVISDQSSIASKFKIAKKALNNVEGILL